MVSDNGKEIQFEDLSPGSMFGELAAIDGKGRSSDCISLNDSTLISMSQSDFLAALDTYNGFNRHVMKRLAGIARRHIGRVFEYGAHSVQERLHFELYRMAIAQDNRLESDVSISNAPTHADIAARISTHREAVTRELKRLENLGIITWNRQKHIIHDLLALTSIRLK